MYSDDGDLTAPVVKSSTPGARQRALERDVVVTHTGFQPNTWPVKRSYFP